MGMKISPNDSYRIKLQQSHDERIRKEERATVKEKLIEKITERGRAFDRVDIEVFFAQLEK